MSKQQPSKKKRTSQALANTLSAFSHDSSPPAAEIKNDPVPPPIPKPKETAPVSPQTKTDKEVKQPSTSDSGITVRITEAFKDWREKVKTEKNRKEFSQRFKEWLMNRLAEKEPEKFQEFVLWLFNLSISEMKLFCQELLDFCSGLGFELAWLVDSQLKTHTQMKLKIEQSVIFYSLAHWKSELVKDDIKATNIFMAWEKRPSTKEHKELSQQIFAGLVEKKLTITPHPKLYMASEEEREQHLIQTIKQAAKKNRQAINTIIKETIVE